MFYIVFIGYNSMEYWQIKSNPLNESTFLQFVLSQYCFNTPPDNTLSYSK